MHLTFSWRLNNLWPEYTVPLRLALVCTVLAMLAFAVNSHPARRLAVVFHDRGPGLVLALAALAVISVPLGIYPGNSLAFLREDYWSTWLFLFLTIASVRSRRDLEFLGVANLVGGLVYSLVVASRFRMTAQGRLSDLVYYDANDYALLLVCCIPIALYFLRSSQPAWRRLLAATSLIVFVVMLVRSGSRGGFVGLVAVLAFVLFRMDTIKRGARVAILTAAVGTILVAGSQQYWNILGTILNPTEDYNYNASHGRREVWRRGVGYMLANPVAGVGIRNFEKAEGWSDQARERYSEGRGFRWTSPHNSFVQIGAELGVTGLLLFLAILWTAYAGLRGVARGAAVGGETRAMALALAASLIGYVVSGFFLSQAYAAFLYWLLGMAFATARVGAWHHTGRGSPGTASAPRPTGRTRGRVAVPGRLLPSA
jgi:O-antigen ligase